MTTWPVIGVTLLMLVPMMVVAMSVQGWVAHFRVEGDSEY
jgi:hypothetical protein